MINGAAKMPSTLTARTASDSTEATRSTSSRVSPSPHSGPVLRQNGHEGLGKRALGEQAPQQIGNAEGDEKGVGGEAGAEQARDHGVAHEAEDAGYQRHAAHRGERAQKIHGPDYTKTSFSGG